MHVWASCQALMFSKLIVVVAQQRRARRYCATIVSTDRLPIATVDYGPLLQCLFVVVRLITKVSYDLKVMTMQRVCSYLISSWDL
jgi:hypothetical protein